MQRDGRRRLKREQSSEEPSTAMGEGKEEEGLPVEVSRRRTFCANVEP